MSSVEDHKKKVACFQCLKRKETIDRLERNYLMLSAWAKQLRKDVTEIVYMVEQLSGELETAKKSWEEEFIGCVEK